MAQSQLFKFGNSVILIQDDAFVDGYYNGLTGHPDSEQPVTVEAVRQIITEAITDVSKPENWNTGYILGAIEGIYIGFRRRDEPDVPQVYFGPVTLHLNRWHFREGYYTGQQDYEAGRQTRTTPERLTARELQDVILRVKRAYDNFFRRVKNGEKPGYPRFQGRNRYDSFTYPDGAGWKLGTHQRPADTKGMVRVNLKLSNMGTVKLHLHRDMAGTIKTLTIKREGEHWYAVFTCQIDTQAALPVSYEDVGIDLGVTHFGALSNGDFIDNPRHYRRAEKKLKKLQEILSRKKRGSHRRKKAVQAVAKAHRKIRNQRADFLHKQSRRLVSRYQVIAFEDLRTTNLVKRPKPKQDEETGQYLPNGAAAKAGLNKSIADAGWSHFVQLCSYKAAWAGRTLIQVDPKYTSQVCSGCGTVVKKDLSERWHSCECGCELDRDTNAAINILHAAYHLLAGTWPTRATA